MMVDHARQILWWQEHLLPKDMPPEWMWHLDKPLKEWFEEVDARYERDRPGGGERRQEPELTKNELF